MPTRGPRGSDRPDSEFDYSTPEAIAAMEGLSELILEIRDEVSRVRYVEDLDLREQSQRIRRVLERLMGQRLAAGAIRVLRPVAWTMRPLRVAIARRRAKTYSQEES